MAGGEVPLRDKSTGYSEWVTVGPKRAQEGSWRMLLSGEVSELRLGQLFSGKPLIITEGRYLPEN
jgi:hypothetical protein